MLDEWNRAFPNCPPIAYHIRDVFPRRWVRFHSLPESKRYPENEAEYASVLHRHNSVLGSLVKPGQSVVLLSTGYSDEPEPTRDSIWAELDPEATPWQTVEDLIGEYGACRYWHLFASERSWRPGVLDSVVRQVADDVIANVLIVEPACRWLVHPYDGGMDVILESTKVRDRLRSIYPDWLSPYSGGL